MLSEKIRELCKSKNTTLSQLEKEIGFGGSTIAKWEKSSPTADKLLKVAQYFNVSLDYLMDYEYGFPLAPEEISLIKRVRAFPPLGQQMVLEMFTNLEKIFGETSAAKGTVS